MAALDTRQKTELNTRDTKKILLISVLLGRVLYNLLYNLMRQPTRHLKTLKVFLINKLHGYFCQYGSLQLLIVHEKIKSGGKKIIEIFCQNRLAAGIN